MNELSTPVKIPFPRSRAQWLVIAGVGAFTLFVGVFCILRHHNLWTRGLDFGLELQVIWNTAQGRWFESSYEVQNYIGDHTAFTDVLFAGVYFLFGSGESVLIAQALMYALGAIFVFRLAIRWLDGSEPLALACTAVYLLQPAAGGALVYDFHPICTVPVFALGCFYYFGQRRWTLGWIWFALVLLTREDACLTGAALGVLVFGLLKHRKTGAVMAVVGFAGFLVMLAVVLPWFRLGEASDTLSRYSHFGNGVGEVARTVLTNPIAVMRHLFGDPLRPLWPFLLLLPWAMLPLRSGWGMLAIALVLAPGLLSTRIPQYTMGWQYPFNSIPIIAIAAIAGLQHLRKRRPQLFADRRKLKRWLTMWAVALLAANCQFNAFVQHRYVLTSEPKRHEVAVMRQRLEADAAVSVSEGLGGQFFDRRQFCVYPQTTWPEDLFPDLPIRKAEYVLIDTTDPHILQDKTPYPPPGYRLDTATEHLHLYRAINTPEPTTDGDKR